ncbi:MAG: AI-2E family transporter [Clostridia bacterium]|nr:AI-2E family transporter [Clostridia bacterium]
MELNSKNFKKLVLLVFLGAFFLTALQNLGGVFGFFSKIISFFSPVIAALCIAFVLNVLLTALETKVFFFMDKSRKGFVKKLKRPLCLVLTYLIALGIVSLLILVIIPDIIDTITYIAEKMPSFVVKARDWVEGLLHRFNIRDGLPEIKINWTAAAKTAKDWLSGYSGRIFGDAVNITTSVFSGVFQTFFSFVISVYVLAQKEKIGRFVRAVIDAFIPEKLTKRIYHISFRTHEAFSRFIGGQLTEALILGVLCFIGMTIFRFPNALIISVLICVTALVPIIGATIGVVIGALLIVITNPLKALLFVVFFLILQQIEGNLIYPKVVGKAVGLPGVIVVSAVLVGGNIGGVLGGLIAVPTCAVIYILLKEAVAEVNQRKLNH